MSPQVMFEFCPPSDQSDCEEKRAIGRILIEAADLTLFFDIPGFDASQAARQVFNECLSQREQEVLTLRLGLKDDSKPESLRGVGAILPREVPAADDRETKVCHQRVSQIEKRALRKLGQGLNARLDPKQREELASLIVKTRYSPRE